MLHESAFDETGAIRRAAKPIKMRCQSNVVALPAATMLSRERAIHFAYPAIAGGK